MNFVDGRLREESGQVFFTVGSISVAVPREKIETAKAADSLTLGIRPEDLILNAAGSASDGRGPAGGAFTGRVVLVERLGATSHVHFDVETDVFRLRSGRCGQAIEAECGGCRDERRLQHASSVHRSLHDGRAASARRAGQ